MGIKKAGNNSSAALIQENENKVSEYSPQLRKLYEYIQNNYSFDSISAACTACDMNYDSVRDAISKHRKKGLDFRDLVYEGLAKRNNRFLAYVDNKVIGEALQSNMTAAKLFYQRTNAIQSGSGGDRVQVNNQVNLTFMSPLPDKDEIDI